MEVVAMMKAVLVSSGVVSLAVILKLSLPVILDILTNDLPHFWSTFTVSWLRPPYLYLLINCIIISILASAKLHPRGSAAATVATEEEKSSAVVVNGRSVAEEREFDLFAPVVAAAEEEEVEEQVKEVVFGYVERKPREDLAVVRKGVVAAESGGDAVVEGGIGGGGGGDEDEVEFKLSKPVWPSPENVIPPMAEVAATVEKPPYSARFGHRKAVRASPEGKTMLKKVSTKPKRQETLESTWRTLTEGRPMPLTRHLKKSDTFAGTPQESPPPVHLLKKSDTFNYGSGGESPSPGSSGGKLRREPSLSQDELNRRVEAFIKKFNEEMRLQRQESINQYRAAVAGAAH